MQIANNHQDGCSATDTLTRSRQSGNFEALKHPRVSIDHALRDLNDYFLGRDLRSYNCPTALARYPGEFSSLDGSICIKPTNEPAPHLTRVNFASCFWGHQKPWLGFSKSTWLDISDSCWPWHTLNYTTDYSGRIGPRWTLVIMEVAPWILRTPLLPAVKVASNPNPRWRWPVLTSLFLKAMWKRRGVSLD
jgi:hypothetical protein